LAEDAFQEMLNQIETSFTRVQVRRERGERLSIIDFTWVQLEQ